MVRGILIIGNDSALIRALEAEAGRRVERFAVSCIPNRLEAASVYNVRTAQELQGQKENNEKRINIEWNPGSPISARTLVISAENSLGHIDDVLLVCSPPSVRCSAADLPLADVEVMVNDHIKGWFFLVKEITAIFKERKHGTLALVYPDINSGKDEAADILGPSALASFRALTNGLLASAQNEPYITTGFSTSDTGNEAAFASFIFKTLDELTKRSKGKLHKFGRFSFFK